MKAIRHYLINIHFPRRELIVQPLVSAMSNVKYAMKMLENPGLFQPMHVIAGNSFEQFYLSWKKHIALCKLSKLSVAWNCAVY